MYENMALTEYLYGILYILSPFTAIRFFRTVLSVGMDLSAGSIIMVFILCLVGLYLSPNIAVAVTTAAKNFTGAAHSVLLLFPLIWVLLMICIPIAFLVAWLRKT
jgi:hypothetical protein